MSISSKESGEYKCRATNPKTLEFVDLKSYKVINYASTGQLAYLYMYMLNVYLYSVSVSISLYVYVKCLPVFSFS